MSQAPSYGATNHYYVSDSSTRTNATEEQPLLGRDTKPPISKRFSDHLNANISESRADLLLLLAYIVTGLLDGCAVKVWGAFGSMQTGNTVYLGLGLAHPDADNKWIKSLMSICCFCFGSFCFAGFTRMFGPKRRWVLCLSFAIQLSLIITSAIIITTYDSEGDELDWHIMVPLALVAFQAAGQAMASRALHYNSLTSVVLTSIYCDLFADPRLLAGITQHKERNRRALAPLLLLAGAVIGGVWSRTAFGMAGAVWTAAALKAVLLIAYLVWPAEATADAD